MKKIELIALSHMVAGLKTPKMSPEKRLTWLRGVRTLTAAYDSVNAEREAIAALEAADETEKNEMWSQVIAEPVAAEIPKIDRDDLLLIIDSNEQLTTSEQLMLINQLSDLS